MQLHSIQLVRAKNVLRLVKHVGLSNLATVLGCTQLELQRMSKGKEPISDDYAYHIEAVLGLPSGEMDKDELDPKKIGINSIFLPTKEVRRHNLRMYLEYKGILRKELADRIGISPGYITHRVSGRTEITDKEARAFEVYMELPEGALDQPISIAEWISRLSKIKKPSSQQKKQNDLIRAHKLSSLLDKMAVGVDDEELAFDLLESVSQAVISSLKRHRKKDEMAQIIKDQVNKDDE